jgi:phosphoribulokinase
MLHGSFMSRANTIVCPGGKMDLAMQLILTPMILRLIERRKEALARLRSSARAAAHVPALQLATAE